MGEVPLYGLGFPRQSLGRGWSSRGNGTKHSHLRTFQLSQSFQVPTGVKLTSPRQATPSKSLAWGEGFGFGFVGFGVWGVEFGVWGVGSGVWGLGCSFWSVGFGVWGFGFGVRGLGCRGLRCRDLGCKDVEFWGVDAWDVWFGVSGLG